MTILFHSRINVSLLLLGFSLGLNFIFLYRSYFSFNSPSNSISKHSTTSANDSKAFWTSNVKDCSNNTIKWEALGTTKNVFGCHIKEILDWIYSLKTKERKVYSQQGEDGITEAIFEKIGHGNKFFVEFGVESGLQCNARVLRERHGWNGVMFDSGNENVKIGLYRVFVWVDTIVELFQKHKVPQVIDYLSVDTDFADLWLINEILKAGYNPRAIVVEINRNFDAYTSLTVPLYAAQNHEIWKGTRRFGTSPLAVAKLLLNHGFYAVYIDKNAINMFFIHKSQLEEIDLTMAHWIETVASGTAVGTPIHIQKNRDLVHICAQTPCSSSNNW